MNALYILCGLGIFSLLSEITSFRKLLPYIITGGLLAAIVVLVFDWNMNHRYYNDMVVFDNYAIAFTALLAAITLLWFWMSIDFFKGEVFKTDRSALVTFAVTGAMIMVSFNNMAMLFLGLEILSISLYALAGSLRGSFNSNEASFKYFLMGSFATGFLLMGIALVYGATGSFDITTIQLALSSNVALPGFFYVGVLLMLVGMLFKMSAVPFHFWAPDVYEGAPTSITAFMSTVVKIAAVGAFLKMFSVAFKDVESTWHISLQVIMVLTLVVPNITAVFQRNVKRVLAYSSIGHVGYILLAFIANPSDQSIIYYYLVTYALASLAAFTILILLEKRGEDNQFNGLFKRNSLAAVAMAIALLSLAGIPPFAGFFGKYMVFASAIKNGYVSLVIVAVVTSLIGVFYYFRILVAMFFKPAEGDIIHIRLSNKVLLAVMITAIILLGVLPDALITLFHR